ncbi:hypothetical protein H3146_00045 [Streptomyces sp. OF3]|uniref:Uncharacterized protein n=1 Tax=Streptomyces alkaliterrae TaxID=2213162 RepID=A0A7W3WG53_9ACTN|nr:hypothetical protein [Streptomyces alkaliterrae]MBB1251762.1 hypothetical protein [Streptomyces alkaliterrae]
MPERNTRHQRHRAQIRIPQTRPRRRMQQPARANSKLNQVAALVEERPQRIRPLPPREPAHLTTRQPQRTARQRHQPTGRDRLPHPLLRHAERDRSIFDQHQFAGHTPPPGVEQPETGDYD